MRRWTVLDAEAKYGYLPRSFMPQMGHAKRMPVFSEAPIYPKPLGCLSGWLRRWALWVLLFNDLQASLLRVSGVPCLRI